MISLQSAASRRSAQTAQGFEAIALFRERVEQVLGSLYRLATIGLQAPSAVVENDDGSRRHASQHMINDNLDSGPRRIAGMNAANYRLVTELSYQAKRPGGEPSHGRAEESRPEAGRVLDGLACALDLPAQQRCGQKIDGDVGKPMISNLVTARRNLSRKIGKGVDAPADQEKRGFHSRPIKMVEQLGRVSRMRAVVERERDPWLAGLDRAKQMPIQVRAHVGVVEKTSRHDVDPSLDASGGGVPARSS